MKDLLKEIAQSAEQLSEVCERQPVTEQLERLKGEVNRLLDMEGVLEWEGEEGRKEYFKTLIN